MKRLGKRETKIIVPFCSVRTQCVIENYIKIVKNSKKKKKEIRLWFISSQNRSEKDEKYGKQKLLFRFVSFLPDAQKKIPKKIKKLKNTIVDSFKAKIGW